MLHYINISLLLIFDFSLNWVVARLAEWLLRRPTNQVIQGSNPATKICPII